MEGGAIREGNEPSTMCRQMKISSILNSCYPVLFPTSSEECEESAARTMLSIVAIDVIMAISKTGTELAAKGFPGLWMLPLGYLFYVSGFMPKALGVVLMVGSTGYVIHAALRIMAPAASEKAMLLSVAAEVATIAWLLAAGVRRNE
ncbi:MAG: DUF4386 domain-containing protein [Spirochaetota bacterium]